MQRLQNCIGPTIRIGQEILCFPYAGFLVLQPNKMVQFFFCIFMSPGGTLLAWNCLLWVESL